MIDTLIMDLDGLLVDTETSRYQAWSTALASLGVPMKKATYIRHTFLDRATSHLHLARILLAAHAPEVARDPDTAQRLVVLARLRSRQMARRALLMPGLAAFIDATIRDGYQLAVVTDSPRDWAIEHLARHQLSAGLSILVTGDDVRERKPDPTPYTTALTRLNISARRCLAFEDSPLGAASARRAGILCAAVPNTLTRGLAFPMATIRIPTLSRCTPARVLDLVTRREGHRR